MEKRPPLEDNLARSASMLLDYVPPRPADAPKVRLGKKQKYQLVVPAVPKGVWVTMNIVPYLKKMIFIDHDLCRFP